MASGADIKIDIKFTERPEETNTIMDMPPRKVTKKNKNTHTYKKYQPTAPRTAHKAKDLLDEKGNPLPTFKNRYAMYYEGTNKKKKPRKDKFPEYTEPPWLQSLKKYTSDKIAAYIRNVQELRTIKSEVSEVKFIKPRLERTAAGAYSVVRLPLLIEGPKKGQTSNKYSLGIARPGEKQRTILLLGTDRAQRTHLIDGLVNYILDVGWKDCFRVTVSNPEEEYVDKPTKGRTVRFQNSEAMTIYSIPSTNKTKLPFVTNIIDAPSFNNETLGTSVEVSASKCMETVENFLRQSVDVHVSTIHAVCIVTTTTTCSKINDAKSVIVRKLEKLFGEKFKDNVCMMECENDETKPNDSKYDIVAQSTIMPHVREFEFGIVEKKKGKNTNNEDRVVSAKIIDKKLWEDGKNKWDAFFGKFDGLQPASLVVDKDRLVEREKLCEGLSHLKSRIKDECQKLQCLSKESSLVSDHSSKGMAIDDVKDFRYEVFEAEKVQRELPYCGEQVTNCSRCGTTCHKHCSIEADSEKYKCIAMENGICKQCGCKWDEHFNKAFVVYIRMKKNSKMFSEISNNYELGLNGSDKVEVLLDELKGKYLATQKLVEENIKKGNELLRKLSTIDGKKEEPLDYIDVVIHEEYRDADPNWTKRIGILKTLRGSVQIGIKMKKQKMK